MFNMSEASDQILVEKPQRTFNISRVFCKLGQWNLDVIYMAKNIKIVVWFLEFRSKKKNQIG